MCPHLLHCGLTEVTPNTCASKETRSQNVCVESMDVHILTLSIPTCVSGNCPWKTTTLGLCSTKLRVHLFCLLAPHTIQHASEDFVGIRPQLLGSNGPRPEMSLKTFTGPIDIGLPNASMTWTRPGLMCNSSVHFIVDELIDHSLNSHLFIDNILPRSSQQPTFIYFITTHPVISEHVLRQNHLGILSKVCW